MAEKSQPMALLGRCATITAPTTMNAVKASVRGDPGCSDLGSKADAERVARRHQQDGAPVVITYPGNVLGPHDPHLSESMRLSATSSRAATR
jgi:dihydroflavonol-4-reductase